MPDYLGEPDHEHGGPQRTGVLLVNLGTPDAPDPPAVRRFLAEFLGDPRVVEAPRWLWWLALHGVILRFRPAKSAHAYRQIWTPRGSPLLLHSKALADRVGDSFRARDVAVAHNDIAVALGMTYGSPSIGSALQQLRREGVRKLLVLPLYPQYSGTTTASVFDRVSAELQRWRRVPELRFIGSYHDEPAYIEAVAASIEAHWRIHSRKHLLFSFHGIPKRYVQAGDPYHGQCLKTAQLVAERLALNAAEWTVSFQSQVGREEWLRPYTDETLIGMARAGQRQVTVACPGFAADCLETLEEIAIRNREGFLQQGGEAYDYVPSLNESEPHVRLIAALIGRHTQGWAIESSGASREEAQQRKPQGGLAR